MSNVPFNANERAAFIKAADILVRNELSFALFRQPGREPGLVLQRNSRETHYERFSDVKGTGFVLCPFDEDQGHPVILIRAELVYRGWEKVAVGLNEVSAACRNVCVPPFAAQSGDELRHRLFSGEPSADYSAMLASALKDLSEGRISKLVLARAQDIAGSFSPGRIFLRACELYPDALISLTHGPSGTWIGASPELLVQGNAMRGWSTMALAGTRRSGTEAPWDEKNRQEQAYVAQYIRETLKDYAEDLTESGPHVCQAGPLEHLRTDFRFELRKGAVLRDLVLALHPTPAVCGLPKAEARRRVLTGEGLDRRYYAGFLGWWDQGRACSLSVNLRCLKYTPGSVRLYAGGGILPESTLASEWQETCGKMLTMLDLLSE